MTDEKTGPKADWLNYSEIQVRTVRALEGGSPSKRPIRKRGFHRALKRGAIWALVEKASIEAINRACRNMYTDPNVPDGTVYAICGLSEILKEET